MERSSSANRPNLELRALLSDRVRAFKDCEAVNSCRQNLDLLKRRIKKVRRHQKKRCGEEHGLIEKRLGEFDAAMDCILDFLEGDQECAQGGFRVIKLDGDFNWDRIHGIMLRERRRLEHGLPIYSFRKAILDQIHRQQIMVLIGETGSGKSTQLVQFLADSGIAADESVVCTQPRKIAAASLSLRVRDESSGCYPKDSVACYPTFSSAHKFDSKVIFMTDHCLLQHYMHDKDLSRISCIIIDEAHERSLNTDLLLALMKDLLTRRFDLRLIIMSATADANQLSEYFFGCEILHVGGRNFPVDVKYVPCDEGTSSCGAVEPYVSGVVTKAIEIHNLEKEGTILAFLTSQAEIEWACAKFASSSAVVLPLHGKLSSEEQFRVFQDYPGKRKVIFSTNIAETSLTIPGVRYVVDPGMVKEHKFEPRTGMNVLKVCRISQSSANQRAGRAGRTRPGICYRLYEKYDYESMPINQEPEIRRVHLGVAILRILALGIKNVQDFDFVDAPSSEAIDLAVRNLVQLEAIVPQNDGFRLTKEGWALVKLDIEPRLGKLILSCFRNQLCREGIVLAALMANASSIFCRVGTDYEKQKSDCLKVQFCHQNGDLFTLLSVYKKWVAEHPEERNKWCWDNSINAKSLRRCHDTVSELEQCLRKELSMVVPSYWSWDPHRQNDQDSCLKRIILSCLSENVAMYSGYDHLGFEVASTGQHVRLHPSCSLLIFGERPSWVVFGEVLSNSISNQFLVCVTAFDFESLSRLNPPPPLIDVSKMERRKLLAKVINGIGSLLLKRFCGGYNTNLVSLVKHLQTTCLDERINIKVNIDPNEVMLFASSEDMEKVYNLVSDKLAYEKKLLQNECMEKCLYPVPGVSPSVALVGAGAMIRHLELQKRCLTVDLIYSNANGIDDKELLMFLEKHASGSICGVQKFTDGKERWGRITFLNPDAAKNVVELNEVEFCGSLLKIIPSKTALTGDNKMFSFPPVTAKIKWPRRHGRGLVRGYAVEGPTCRACEEELLKEISLFMPMRSPLTYCCRVQVFQPKPEDFFMRALITFDGRLHLEAATALEQIEGKVLPGCQPWQKIICQRLFESSLSCSAPIYHAIKKQLNSLLKTCAEYTLVANDYGSYRIKISANATKTVADLRRPVEELVKGKTVNHDSLSPTLLQLLSSRDGSLLMKSLQWKTGTYIMFNKRNFNVRIFGSSYSVVVAERELINSLLSLHKSKQLEVRLGGRGVRPDLMKLVVERFGPDLSGLKEKVQEREFSLNTQRHVISIKGSKETKQKVEEIIHEIAETRVCPICLCEVEEGYRLESCGHMFCRSCLVEQLESAIRNREGFPICCAHEGCNDPIIVSDLRLVLSDEKLEDLFRASLVSFVASSRGAYRFCPSPDCPSVYRMADPGTAGEGFACEACYAETCTRCHLEYHRDMSCEVYKHLKNDPDTSLKEWMKGREDVKTCPACGYTIEKTEGCNHMACRCGKHLCWNCLIYFNNSNDCYAHLRSDHPDDLL